VQFHIPYTLVNLFGENRVAVMDQEAIGMKGDKIIAEQGWFSKPEKGGRPPMDPDIRDRSICDSR
jgi:hypothetical protein